MKAILSAGTLQVDISNQSEMSVRVISGQGRGKELLSIESLTWSCDLPRALDQRIQSHWLKNLNASHPANGQRMQVGWCRSVCKVLNTDQAVEVYSGDKEACLPYNQAPVWGTLTNQLWWSKMFNCTVIGRRVYNFLLTHGLDNVLTKQSHNKKKVARQTKIGRFL